MHYENEEIAAALGVARVAKGFSQRALSQASGVPQAQISRIEKGVVDLRLSSLVALARALDLELTLIPRKALPAVRSVVRSSEPAAGDQGGQARKALQSLQRTITALPDPTRDTTAFLQLQRQIREIQNLRLSVPQVEAVKKLRKDLAALRDGAALPDALHRAIAQIEALRNAAAHASEAPVVSSSVRPAYTLDEDEDGDA
jgi:transcriptional regulator with XRE-family HTH domain